MGRWHAETCLLYLLVLIITSLIGSPGSWVQAQPSAGEEQVEVHISSGQQLAAVVGEWGAAGSNMTVYIDVPYISMQNVTFTSFDVVAARSSRPPFSQGTITIKGKPSNGTWPTTILDARMMFGIMPTLTNSARYALEDLIIINGCELTYPFIYGSGRITSTPPTPFGIPLFGRITNAYQSQKLSNVICYGRPAAMSFQLYQVMMQATAIPELRALSSTLVNQASGLPLEPVDEFSPYVQGVKAYIWTLGIYYNFTLKSLANPSDPLLDHLRRENKMMPPQHCNGTLLTQEQVDEEIDANVSPMRSASDQAGFERALDLTVKQTAIQLQIEGPPAAMLLGKGQYLVPGDAIYTVASVMLISGHRTSPPPSEAFNPVLNLRQRVGVFQLAPDARMLFQHMVLDGLVSQVPAQILPGLSADKLQPSVFPLAAFRTLPGPDTWTNFSSIIAYNVTLIIPPEEFLALTVMSSRQAGVDSCDCVSASTLELAAQLQAGFTKIRFEQQEAPVAQTPLFVSQLQGLGLNASTLRIFPSSPVQLPICSSRSKRKKGWVIGLVMGISGFVILGALITTWVLWLRRRRQRVDADTTGLTKLPAASYRSPATLKAQRTELPGSHMSNFNPLFSNQSSPASKNRSALMSRVQQARESTHMSMQSVLAANASRQSSGPTAAANGEPVEDAELGLTPEVLLDQVQQLAEQLNQDNDTLVLAGVLGSGSSGTVFSGVWKGLQVAVKTLVYRDYSDEKRSPDDHVSKKPPVVMEAAIAASVGHANLVATYHYDVKALSSAAALKQPGGLQISSSVRSSQEDAPTYKLFLIQELCDMSLADGLDTNLFSFAETNELDLEGVLLTLIDIAQGLSYLHSRNIIHGDLKPENIMLKLHADASHGIIAKLTDFGLSTKLGPGVTHVSNFKCGSPFYVAPEVVHKHQAGPASDIYSFGIILGELYTRCRAFISTPEGMLIPNPMFPGFSDNHPPPPVYALLYRRCCAADFKQRPTAQEVVYTLGTLLNTVRMDSFLLNL